MLFKTTLAKKGPPKKRIDPDRNPETRPESNTNVAIWPQMNWFFSLNSLTYLVAVKLKPKPLKSWKRFSVDRPIEKRPNWSFPRTRAKMMDEAKRNKRLVALLRDVHMAPLANL